MFVQVVQGKTTDAEGVMRQAARWDEDVKPHAVGYLGSTGGVADDGTVLFVARFADDGSAQANSDLPQQSAWWNEMEKYLTDVEFRNSTDVEQPLGEPSDNAGFVQVMQGRCTDRKRLAEMEAQVTPQMHSARPDVLGSVRAWFNGDNYVEAIYFSSEADARQGEQTMPEAIEGVSFEEFMSLTPEVQYVDLKNPILRSA